MKTLARQGVRFAALLLAIAATTAGAQIIEPQSFPVDRLRLASDGLGLIDVEWGAGPETPFEWWAGGAVSYLSDPLVLSAGDERISPLLEHRASLDLVGSVAFHSMVSLGLGARVILYQSRPDLPTIQGLDGTLPALATAGLGDLRLSPKFTLLRVNDGAPIDLAVLTTVGIPTAGSRGYMGDTGFTVFPELALSRQFGDLRFALNAGYLLRPGVEFLGLVIDDEVQVRFGVGAFFGDDPSARTRLDASVSVAMPTATGAFDPGQSGIELMVVGYQPMGAGLELFVGGGGGLASGFGNPDLRLTLGARYRGVAEE